MARCITEENMTITDRLEGEIMTGIDYPPQDEKGVRGIVREIETESETEIETESETESETEIETEIETETEKEKEKEKEKETEIEIVGIGHLRRRPQEGHHHLAHHESQVVDGRRLGLAGIEVPIEMKEANITIDPADIRPHRGVHLRGVRTLHDGRREARVQDRTKVLHHRLHRLTTPAVQLADDLGPLHGVRKVLCIEAHHPLDGNSRGVL
ncbi:hypothetical protein V1522DRAFT_434920 [Lipomyces starkeyi]